MPITVWVMLRKWFSMLFDRRFVIKCVLHWCPVFFNAFGTRIKPKKEKISSSTSFSCFSTGLYRVCCAATTTTRWLRAAVPIHQHHNSTMQLSFFLSFRVIHSFRLSLFHSLSPPPPTHFFFDFEFDHTFFFLSFFSRAYFIIFYSNSCTYTNTYIHSCDKVGSFILCVLRDDVF